MYKTLGIKWLHEAFCPALAFVSADSDEARNPQRFIHVTVRRQFKSDHATDCLLILMYLKFHLEVQQKNQERLKL